MKEIIKSFNRIIKIYQIPNIDNEGLVYLAEWIMEEYQHHDFALIQEALKYPPRNPDNTWRMTPDTIRFWIDKTQEKVFDRKQKEESQTRQEVENQKHVYSPETEKIIQDFKNKLMDGIKDAPVMTEKEIKENGQLRPKAVKRQSTSQEYLIEKELLRQWALEVHDKYTGERLDNWLSFEEWKLI
jgi:hypothetical protein